jgi:RNA polymerase sigma-70 factor (ECF subfamily)
VTSEPDADIRERLLARDPVALELIYDRYASSLHAYIAAVVGRARADDVLQDVLVSVAEQRERVARADDLPAYLARMARNRALDLVRRSGRREQALDDDHVAPKAEARAEVPTDAIATALAALPDEQREVVALKVHAGLTFAAIAEVLGIPANTAASRYRYALEKLARQLSGDRHDA